MAKIIWQIVYMTFNIIPPTNITNMFGNWLHGVPKKDKSDIRVGVCALLWAIWHVRNDIIFNKTKVSSFLQVIPLATHWIRMWSYLHPDVWKWLHRDSSTNTAGSLITDYHVKA